MRAIVIALGAAALFALAGCSDSPTGGIEATVKVEKPGDTVIVDDCNAECKAIVEHRRAQASKPMKWGN